MALFCFSFMGPSESVYRNISAYIFIGTIGVFNSWLTMEINSSLDLSFFISSSFADFRNTINIIIAAVVPASKEKVSTLCLKRLSLIVEYIVEVGVTIKMKYAGFPLRNIGLPVFNLSPLPKSYTA